MHGVSFYAAAPMPDAMTEGARADSSIVKHRAFVETVRSGGLTRAAEILGISQSGVSRMISDLEREWGVRLLERGRGGVTLTPEGERLYARSADLCASYDELVRTAGEVGGAGIGMIRIGTFSSVATHRLPDIIRRFQEGHPGAGYELLLGDYTEIERWVREGRVDLGFLTVPDAPGLRSDLMELDEMLAVLPEGDPLASGGSVRLEDLCGRPFMMLEKGGPSEVSGMFSSKGLRPETVFTTWDDYAIMSMVESGLGVAVLPSLILERSPYRIAARPLDPPEHRGIYLVTRGDGRLTAAARAFMAYLPGRMRRSIHSGSVLYGRRAMPVPWTTSPRTSSSRRAASAAMRRRSTS